MAQRIYQGGDYLAEGGRVFGRHTVDDAPLELAVTRANRTLYDPEHVLVPDSITDACGRFVAFCIDDYPILGYREPVPVRAVDMGTGSGVFAVSMLDGLKIPTVKPFEVDIIDASSTALVVAQVNIDKSIDYSPRPIEANYLNGDYLDTLSGLYDYIYFNPPYLEPGHVITHPEARLAPAEAIYVDESIQEYARIVPYLETFLTEKGIALIRLPREDAKIDQWVLEYMRQHVNARLILINDDNGRLGRILTIAKTRLPDAVGSYDYWENYLGGDERRARVKSAQIPIYHDNNCEIVLVRKGPDATLLGGQAIKDAQVS